MDVTEDIEYLERNLNAASAKLQQGLIMRAGGVQAEARYADAYERLVRVGARVRLRRKYRRA